MNVHLLFETSVFAKAFSFNGYMGCQVFKRKDTKLEWWLKINTLKRNYCILWRGVKNFRRFIARKSALKWHNYRMFWSPIIVLSKQIIGDQNIDNCVFSKADLRAISMWYIYHAELKSTNALRYISRQTRSFQWRWKTVQMWEM